MAVPTGRESDKFMLRLPDGMRERIRRAAEANNRSMNAEIVARLGASLGPPDIEMELERERRALESTLDTLAGRTERQSFGEHSDPQGLERQVQEVANGLIALEASMSTFMDSVVKRLDQMLVDREKS